LIHYVLHIGAAVEMAKIYPRALSNLHEANIDARRQIHNGLEGSGRGYGAAFLQIPRSFRRRGLG
jgi:hypothetical protein